MSIFHDEVEIEDFEYDEESDTYYYPCPCGDQFEITRVRLGFCVSARGWLLIECININSTGRLGEW